MPFLRLVERFLFFMSTSLTADLRLRKGRLIAWLFVTKMLLTMLNTMLVTVRESLIISEGKVLQSRLMAISTVISMFGQSIVASSSSQYGAFTSFRILFQLSAFVTILTYTVVIFGSDFISFVLILLFYLYHTFFNMTCVSLYWTVAGDALGEDAHNVFGAIAAGGTAGQFMGAVLISYAANTIGAVHALMILFIIGVLGAASIATTENRAIESARDNKEILQSKGAADKNGIMKTVLGSIVGELKANVQTLAQIWSNRLLRTAFAYALFFSCTVGLNILERSAAAKRISLNKDTFAGALGNNQIWSTVLQFLIQLVGTSTLINYFGPGMSLSFFALIRLLSFSLILFLQMSPKSAYSQWYYQGDAQVVTVLWFDSIARLVNASISKISKESMWMAVPLDVRYRAKMVIDVFAYRLGTGFAAIVGTLPIVDLIPIFKGTHSHVVAGIVTCVFWLYGALVMGHEIKVAVEKAKLGKDKTD